MMPLNISRECCGFISLASPSTNDPLSCSIRQLPIFSDITENETIYPFLAIPKQLLSSWAVTASSWYLLTLELSRHILPHGLSQPTGCTKVHLFSLLMVTSCSTSFLMYINTGNHEQTYRSPRYWIVTEEESSQKHLDCAYDVSCATQFRM